MTQTIRGKSAAGMLMIAALTLGAGGELRAQAGAGMMASPWTGSMQPGNNASIGGDLPSDFWGRRFQFRLLDQDPQFTHRRR